MSRFDPERLGAAAAEIIRDNVRRVDAAIASALRPPPRISVSEWAARFRKFPDDSAYPGDWNHDTAPELVEIMDAMSPHDRCEEASLIKCAQSGGSASAENLLGYIADIAPGATLWVQATYQAALSWADEKLWPMIEATPRLNPDRGGAVRARGAGRSEGSTKQRILFTRSNGYIKLAGANSAAGLRQSTVRHAVEDDLDQFPSDLDKQGSPESMVGERLKVWRNRGMSKRLKISTPTIAKGSKIASAYQSSDRRRYHLKCPSCGSRFTPEWDDIQWPKSPQVRPDLAYMVAPCCGSVIEHYQKGAMKLPDGWLSDEIDGEPMPRVMTEEAFQAARARMPESKRRGFHLVGEISTFQSWAEMAEKFVDAQGDVSKLMAWTNLQRGYAFEVASDAPDYEKLKELKEQHWGFGQMPVGPIVTTLGVDVQGDGIYLEKQGWGPNWENWQLDARFLPGDTDIEGEGAWRALDEYSQRGTVFPGGLVVPIDQECVDAGYHTPSAQAYCAARPNRLAVFGRAGWGRPVLGRGEPIGFVQNGSRAGNATRRQEDRAYIVGANTVKLSWYGFLRNTLKAVFPTDEDAKADDSAAVLIGRVHVSRDAPDEWFDQATAETIQVKMVNGIPDRRWVPVPGRENHYLDCRVYGRAAAERLALDALTPDDWARLKATRYANPEEPDAPALIPKVEPEADDEPRRQDRGEDQWIDAGEDWLS